MFLALAKTSCWNSGTSQARKRLMRVNAGLEFAALKAYVGNTTDAPTAPKAGLVKDCTTGRFCLMGLRGSGDWRNACHQSLRKGSRLVAALPEDECIDC
jgi:hypothetical protein